MTHDRIRPFLKWAGGKSQLLETFDGLYPAKFSRYFEPFLGSGAVFFHLSQLARPGLSRRPPFTARLTDNNQELINCYQVVRDDLDALLPLLGEHRRRHSARHYYHVRAQNVEQLSPLERAARLIYLNKTCYNGLYRVNRHGQFNVPMGSYLKPRVFDPELLRQAQAALQNVELAIATFREIVTHARRGDFVYFDPPYFPLSKTASFTTYTRDAFGEEEQIALAEVFATLDRKGCSLMLSNSWTPFIRELYRDYNTIQVNAARAINSQATGRGKIGEIVVLNYDLPAGK